jgi:hypothetical protein
MKLTDYLRTIKLGENVLVEHTSLSGYPEIFYLIGETHGWEKVLLVDIMDSSLTVLRWISISGRKIPENIVRLKAGGYSDWGKVLLTIDPHKDPGIFLSRFDRTVREYYSRHPNTVTIALNPERLIPLQNNDPQFILALAIFSAGFTGLPRRSFHFVNVDIADRRYVALLEEAFIMILRIEGDEKVLVVKSPVREEEGTELELY